MFGFHSLSTCFISIAAVTLLGHTSSEAGQYKTLNTETLAVNTSRVVNSSPQNTGAAAEMEVYEFRSAVAGGKYSCAVLGNATGTALNLRLLGVNGSQLASCTAAPGLGCSTPVLAFVGNLKFICLVATQNGSPVVTNSRYLFRVARHP
jgi:hypothetical protein